MWSDLREKEIREEDVSEKDMKAKNVKEVESVGKKTVLRARISVSITQ
jgi:hypothetical protein